MSFMLDIATSQNALDLNRCAQEGADGFIVKLGGANTGELYVSPFYHAELDKARATGKGVGIYVVVGRHHSPEQLAQHVMANLYRFDMAHDVIGLDNEPLDSASVFWSDAEVRRFWAEIARLGGPQGFTLNRGWEYSPASLTRGNRPWSFEDLGVRVWWAAYGGQPSGHQPDHTPDTQGSVRKVDIHQFSSNVLIAGQRVDGNYSALSVSELFGGGPVQTSSQPVGPTGTSSQLPRTTTEDDGKPGSVFWKRFQTVASRWGYNGPIDGDAGGNTYRAFAAFLNSLDTKGTIGRTSTQEDGKPGSVFYKRLQFLASMNGYRGPIDGDPGENTWKGVARYLNLAV